MLQEDLKGVLAILVEDEQFLDINIELVDNNLAKLFDSSLVSDNNFSNYPQLLRQGNMN